MREKSAFFIVIGTGDDEDNGDDGGNENLRHFECAETGFELTDEFAFVLSWRHDEAFGHDDAVVGGIHLCIADERTSERHFLHFPKSTNFKHEVTVNFQIFRLDTLRIVCHVLPFLESLHVILHEFLAFLEEIVDLEGVGRCVRIGIHAEVQQVVVFSIDFRGSPEEIVRFFLDEIDVVRRAYFATKLFFCLVHDGEARFLLQFCLLAQQFCIRENRQNLLSVLFTEFIERGIVGGGERNDYLWTSIHVACDSALRLLVFPADFC